MLKKDAIIIVFIVFLCSVGCYENIIEEEVEEQDTELYEPDSEQPEDSETATEFYESDSWIDDDDSLSDDTETETEADSETETVEPEYDRYSVCQNIKESSNPLVIVGDCFPEDGLPLETRRKDVKVDAGDLPDGLKIVDSFIYTEDQEGWGWRLSLRIKNVGTTAICNFINMDVYYLDSDGLTLSNGFIVVYEHSYYTNNHLYRCIPPGETIYVRDARSRELELDRLDSVILDNADFTERVFEGPLRSLVRPTGYRLVYGEEAWFDDGPELLVDIASDYDYPLQVFSCYYTALDDNENPIIQTPALYVRNGGELPPRGTISVGIPWEYNVQSNRLAVTCYYNFRI